MRSLKSQSTHYIVDFIVSLPFLILSLLVSITVANIGHFNALQKSSIQPVVRIHIVYHHAVCQRTNYIHLKEKREAHHINLVKYT